MTTASSIEERLAAVEEAIADLRRKDDRPTEHPDWLGRLRGSLRGEPAFAEVIALGREFRMSDRPAEDEGN